jgi:hypothetical protein
MLSPCEHQEERNTEMKKLWILLSAILTVVTLAGCGGGGGGGGVNDDSVVSLSGTIDGTGSLTPSDSENIDHSHYDKVLIRPTHDGYVYVSMESTEMDPYIVVYQGTVGDPDYQIISDDDSGEINNAYCEFYASADETYMIMLTSSKPDNFGNYRYTIGIDSGSYSLSRGPKKSKDINDKPVIEPAKKASRIE